LAILLLSVSLVYNERKWYKNQQELKKSCSLFLDAVMEMLAKPMVFLLNEFEKNKKTEKSK
jgi:hypothetical protein